VSTYAFNDVERYAVYIVHGEKCYICREPIDLLTMEVDHVIPEWLLSQRVQLQGILNGYGLPENFDLNSYPNWMPSWRNCNSRKRGRVFNPTPRIQIELQMAAEKAPRAAALAADTVAKQTVTKAMNTIKRAHKDGTLTSEMLAELGPIVDLHLRTREPEMVREIFRLTPVVGARTTFVHSIPIGPEVEGEEEVQLQIDHIRPPTAFGVVLAIEPTDGKLGPVDCSVRSNIDSVVVNSIASQACAVFLRTAGSASFIWAKVANPTRRVRVVGKGWIEII
jgi:hypothetical protein